MPTGQEIARIPDAHQPDFNYDGQRLLFDRERSGVNYIYEYNLPAHTEVPVTDIPHNEYPIYDLWGNRVAYGNTGLTLGRAEWARAENGDIIVTGQTISIENALDLLDDLEIDLPEFDQPAGLPGQPIAPPPISPPGLVDRIRDQLRDRLREEIGDSVLAVACAVFLYLSMVMPVAAGFLAEGGEKWKEKGPFNLGGFSKPNALLAVICGITLAITGFFPPNEKVFYFTIIFVVALLGLWSKKTAFAGIILAVVGYGLSFINVPESNNLHFLIPPAGTGITAIIVGVVTTVFTFVTGGEDMRFEGVPEGDKIAQRQKMIAEIEKKYGEA